MRPILLSFIALVALVALTAAQETASLSAPILARPGISTMRPAHISVDIQRGELVVVLKEWSAGAFVDDGRHLSVRYDANGSSGSGGVTTVEAGVGRALITALNKANLSTTSLERRILQRLIADGHLAGSVTGTPQ
jgi:hypothetical protein